MEVTLTPIVNGVLGIILNGLVRGLKDLEIGGRVEAIKTRVLWQSIRIL